MTTSAHGGLSRLGALAGTPDADRHVGDQLLPGHRGPAAQPVASDLRLGGGTAAPPVRPLVLGTVVPREPVASDTAG